MAATQPAVTERLNAQTPTAPGMDKEPAVTIGAVGAFVGAVLALLVLFGIDISPEQSAGILAVLATGAPILTAVWVRRKVYAPKTVRTLANQAELQGYEAAQEDVSRPRDQLPAGRPGT